MTQLLFLEKQHQSFSTVVLTRAFFLFVKLRFWLVRGWLLVHLLACSFSFLAVLFFCFFCSVLLLLTLGHVSNGPYESVAGGASGDGVGAARHRHSHDRPGRDDDGDGRDDDEGDGRDDDEGDGNGDDGGEKR